MVMKHRKGILARFGDNLVHHPSRIPEALVAIGVPLLLWLVGHHSGGDFERDSGMELAVPWCFCLTGIWAIWWVLKGQALEISKGALWTAPFILYLTFHTQLLASAPWRAAPTAGMLFLAWLVYLLVAHTIRQRSLLYLMTGLTLGVNFLIGLEVLGFSLSRFVFELFNSAQSVEWSRPVEVAPFGVFETAPSMIFGWFLTIPFAAIGMGLPRLAGYLRIALGGYLLFGFYQIGVAGNDAGYVILLGFGILLPLFLRPHWNQRWRIYGLIVVIGMISSILYLLGSGLHDRIDSARSMQPPLVESARWSASLDVWREVPLIGVGVGTLSLALENVPFSASEDDAAGSRQSTLQLFAELGWVGVGLALLALWGTFGRLFQAWRREPFFPKDKEAEFRNSSGPGEGKNAPAPARRRRREHRLKDSTTRKIFLGGVVLGLLVCLLFIQFESSWQTGMPWILVAIWAGLGERFLFEERDCVSLAGRKSPLRFGFAAVALVFCAVSLRILDHFRAETDVWEAQRALEPFAENPDLAFEQPAGVLAARRSTDHALELIPRHADAWALRARTFLYEESIARIPLEEVGALVAEAAEEAVRIYPKSGYFQFLRAEGWALSNREPEVVDSAFHEAAQMAPANLEILFAWAHYRYRDRNDKAGAHELIDRILNRDPSHRKALELKRRLDL